MSVMCNGIHAHVEVEAAEATRAIPVSATAKPADVLSGAAKWALVEGSNADPVTGLASLPDKSISHTIMDPPFEAEAHSKGRRIGKGGGKGGRGSATLISKPISYDPITNDEREAVADQVSRVTRGWSGVFCQSEAAHLWRGAFDCDGGARYMRTGIYWKEDAQPQYSGDRPGVGWEAIVFHWHGEGRPSWNGGGRCGRWMATRDGRNGSGPQALVDGCKPLALMDQLVADFTDPDDVILDPYSGSATTLLAALRGNRRAIGWEKKAEHYTIGRARLSGGEVRPVPGQISIFGEARP